MGQGDGGPDSEDDQEDRDIGPDDRIQEGLLGLVFPRIKKGDDPVLAHHGNYETDPDGQDAIQDLQGPIPGCRAFLRTHGRKKDDERDEEKGEQDSCGAERAETPEGFVLFHVMGRDEQDRINQQDQHRHGEGHPQKDARDRGIDIGEDHIADHPDVLEIAFPVEHEAFDDHSDEQSDPGFQGDSPEQGRPGIEHGQRHDRLAGEAPRRHDGQQQTSEDEVTHFFHGAITPLLIACRPPRWKKSQDNIPVRNYALSGWPN